MIQANELRLGNYILHKVNNRITMVKCSVEHFNLLSSGDSSTMFPVQLKATVLEQCGFIENKDYALLPTAHEYFLTIPVSGNNKNEIVAYIKSNNECFCRAIVNGLVVSNSVYYLHQLQNLYYSLTGNEMEIKV
jgi:hypothetical protein